MSKSWPRRSMDRCVIYTVEIGWDDVPGVLGLCPQYFETTSAIPYCDASPDRFLSGDEWRSGSFYPRNLHISKMIFLSKFFPSSVSSTLGTSRKLHISKMILLPKFFPWSVSSTNSSTKFCTISLAPPVISVDTNGYGNSYFVNRSMSVKTKMCFTLVRFAIVTGHKMFAANLLNRIL